MTTQTVTIVGPNLINQNRGQLEVHRPDCKARYRNTRENPKHAGWDVDVEDTLDVASAVYDDHAGDEGLEYGTLDYWEYQQGNLSDFNFCNCVSVPEVTPAEKTALTAPEAAPSIPAIDGLIGYSGAPLALVAGNDVVATIDAATAKRLLPKLVELALSEETS